LQRLADAHVDDADLLKRDEAELVLRPELLAQTH
jgi:hypothetical protein